MRQIILFVLVLGAGLPTAALAQTLSVSELPIVLIHTDAAEIPNEPKIPAKMQVIYNGPGILNSITDQPTAYNGEIGIEVRGSSSAYMPQRPYAIETRDALGNERTVSLLGMPEESDWCLISNYNEKTLVRNPISYHLFGEMGQYASRGQLVEVVLNGQYEGIYFLCERIKRDPNRVAVSKADLTALSGDELTGGYIFKIDYAQWNDFFPSKFKPFGHPNMEIRYVFHYPKVDDLTAAQRQYLEEYVDRAEAVLFGPQFKDTMLGYHRYFDQASFVDYFLLNELARNNDGSKKKPLFLQRPQQQRQPNPCRAGLGL